MNRKKISVVDAVSFAFRSILDHIRLFFFVFIFGSGLIALVVGLLGLINKSLVFAVIDSPMFQNIQECVGSHCLKTVYQSGKPFISFIFNNALPLLISAFIMAFFFVGLDLGFKAIALDVYDKNDGTVETLWSRYKLALSAFVAWALYCAMAWIGFMFFVVPGFIVLLRFAFFPFFIIDKKMGAIESLKKSYEVTSNHMWDIFAFWMVVKIIVYVGFLTYVGTILTWPVSTLAYAYVYRQLVPRT